MDDIEDGALHVVRVGLPSIAILMTVGMIIGIWIASGTVPLLIYYGLKVLSPEIFLAAGMVLCAVVSFPWVPPGVLPVLWVWL